MAHIYPKKIPVDCTSSGEKKVFEFLNAKAPSDWHILHSFRLPKHRNVVFGEADFVIISPQYGIFVLEVKAGGVGFDGTDWIFRNREGVQTRKQRGPFQQAQEAMYEVEKILIERLGDSFGRKKILYGYGVIFTDEGNFPASGMTEDASWRLCQNNDRNDYCEFVKLLARNFKHELLTLGKQVPDILSISNAKIIAKTLRPIIECVTPLKSFIKASEDQIIELTEEQFDCLDDIEVNKQIVIMGGAGTGKTLLAVEDSKRAAQFLERIGFFCYNKNLAAFIRNNIKEPNVEVATFHSYMEKHIDIPSELDISNEQEYYTKNLPHHVCESFKHKNYPKFDKIIIDEFQDLCTEEYLAVMDISLNGGLIDGRFSFYSDFARQAIFNESSSLDILKNKAFFAQKRLSINCRNTQYIGNELINVTGHEDKKYRLKVLGEPVDYYTWTSVEEEAERLKICIAELKKKGFGSESIMVLSPYRRENSVVGVYDVDRYIIGNYRDDILSYLAVFSTVSAFKGLESKIVILTDIESYSDTKLMYVALSRARSKLIILESVVAAEQRKKLMIART
jgi:hypothetical protein